MVFQAFMDESEGKDGTLVIAGHIATVQSWANLAREWEMALPGAIPRDPPKGLTAAERFRPTDERPGAIPRHRDRFHVHVAEMSDEARRQKLPGFFRIIERHVALSLSARVHLAEIERAKARVYVPGLHIDWGFMDNPWMVAWRVLMDRFHHSREAVEKVIPLDSTIDFYFDERATEKKVIRDAWDAYIESRPEPQRQRYGREPRFEDDQEFLGIQAADLWAWWVRKWHAEGSPETMEFGEAGGLGLGPAHPKMDISIDEEGLVLEIKKIIAAGIEPGRPIYDRGAHRAFTRSLNEVSWGAAPSESGAQKPPRPR